MLMRRWTPAIALTVVLMPLSARSWGDQGHRIVAMVAESKLEPEARKILKRLLGRRSLASAATWADDIKEICERTRRWHYVDIPVYVHESAGVYDPRRDCAKDPRKGDCAIAAIDFYRASLEDPATSDQDRLVAVALLTHFIGDIHQPLHTADNHDAGGNGTYVRFFNHTVNLHTLWDTSILNAMLDSTHGSESKLARVLIQRAAGNLETLGRGSQVDWVHEAHRLARLQAYKLPPPSVNVTVWNDKTRRKRKLVVPRLGQTYLSESSRVVEDQLLRAGVRLARVLNRVVAGQAAVPGGLGMTCPVRH